jgi:hypothetical protein
MQQEMCRLILVHGPWQLLLAVSAMKQAATSSKAVFQDELVIIARREGSFPSPLGEVMRRIASVVWPWSRVVVIDDTDDFDLFDARRRPVEALRAKLGPGKPDEVWMNFLGGFNLADRHRAIARAMADAYASARLVLYEDGLDSYLPTDDSHLSLSQCLKRPRRTYRAIKARVREWRKPSDLSVAPLLQRHLARVVASYLWISLMVSPPPFQRRLPWIQLQTRFLKETIEQVTPIVDDIGLQGMTAGSRRVIVLGQCFASWGVLPKDVELDCYVSMTRRLQEMGYEVLWKEHPRMSEPLLPDLTKVVPGIRSLPELGPWPIELFVERLGLAACASLTSTTLFSMPLLFGLPSFSPVHRYISAFIFPFDKMARLVAELIPDLEASGATPQARRMTEESTHPLAKPTEFQVERSVESVP